MLRIHLLGDFKVALGDDPVTSLKSPRLQALLTYLLLHRDSPQPRHHIAFLFWPDSSEQQALTNLRKLLHEFRAALPGAESYIDLDHSTLRWRPGPDAPFVVDIDQFEQAYSEAHLHLSGPVHVSNESVPEVDSLRKVVNLYSGDLLPSCYDEWIAAPRERLRDNFLVALHALVEALEKSSSYDQAIRYARNLLRYDPLLEDNYRRLMHLHLLNNDRASALNVFKQCALMMKREFDIEPGQVTLDLLKQAQAAATGTGGQQGAPRPLSPQLSVPAQTTAFFGREGELAELASLLRAEQIRLVTLLGMAGMGKTRLSVQASAGLAPHFAGGIYFVPLAAIDEPSEDLVVRAIASTLELAETGAVDLRSILKRALANKQTLLILDNFEQILPAATVVADLLAACPRLKVLATSRAPLNIRGEHEFPVPPLPVPPSDAPARLEDMVQYESAALFIDRALEVYSKLELSPSNLRAIASICRSLEGLPLSIELAAAHVNVLAPPAILARLDRRLKLLVGGKADLPARQRALETAIDWSYNLLSDTEKAMFRSLSVFVGGFTLDAAEAVLDHLADDVREGVASLVNKSLIGRSEDFEGEPRFSMLETLKDYAGERLARSGEARSAKGRHALYFMRWAEQIDPQIVGPEQASQLRKTEIEHDNLRAALDWTIAEGDAEGALRLTGALGGFWQYRSYFSEGRRWFSRALDLGLALLRSRNGEKHTFGHAGSENRELESWIGRDLHNAGFLAMRQGDYKEARELCTQSLEIYRALEDEPRVARVLVTLGNTEFHMGAYGPARLYCEEGLQLLRRLGEEAGISFAAQSLGLISSHQGRYDEARHYFEESLGIERARGNKSGMALNLLWSARLALNYLHDTQLALSQFEEGLALSRELGNRWMEGWLLLNLGEVARFEERYSDARDLYRQSRQILKEIGEKPGVATSSINLAYLLLDEDDASKTGLWELLTEALSILQEDNDRMALLQSIAGFGRYWARQGRLEQAATLFGATFALHKQFGIVMDAVDRVAVERWIGEARSRLDPESWQLAWDAGAAMTLDQAIALTVNPA